jgi:hypothetical protein
MELVMAVDKLRGSAILELITSLSSLNSNLFVNLEEGKVSGSFTTQILRRGLFGKQCSIGLLIKTSSKRRSPWQYSFHRENQEEIESLRIANDEVFILLINGDDGVACISYQLLKQLLDDKFEDVEAVRVSRRIKEAYRISGRDGQLDNPLPKNSFPNLILDWVNEKF